MIDAADAFEQTRLSGGGSDGSNGPSSALWVKNTSGDEVPQYGILSCGPPLYTPDANLDEFKRKYAFNGITPEAGNVLIALEPMAKGAVSDQVIASGTTIVQVDVSDASHDYADADPGNVENLVSGNSGPLRILWKESGTGVKWAMVRFEQSPAAGAILYGIATENWRHVPDAVGLDAVTVHQILPDGTTDTVDITVYFPGCTGLNDGNGSANVVEGQWVTYTLNQVSGSPPNNYNVCLSPEAYDENVGTIAMGTQASLYRSGWGLMDGTGNSAGNGGSGVNMTNRFPRGNFGFGGGGSDTHVHPDHAATATSTESGAGGTTGLCETAVGGNDAKHTHQTPVLVHSAGDNVPLYYGLYFYERLDNSA